MGTTTNPELSSTSTAPSSPNKTKIQFHRPWLYTEQAAAIYDPARLSLIEATTKGGKAQPLDAVVYTPAGPTRMGDLRLGDAVLTPDGGRASIIGIYPQGPREIFRVTFSDGSSTEVDAEHLWEVQGFREPSRVISTAEVAGLKSWRRHRTWVPGILPVDFDPQPVPFDAYALGLLLGDGGLGHECVFFSSADQELVRAMELAIPAGHKLRKCLGDNVDWAITAGKQAAALRDAGTHLRGILNKLGIIGKGSHEKFVPPAYKYNSIAVRRAVLQGLLDTDGFVDRHGQPAIEQTSPQLASDIEEIVQSLGGTVLSRYRAVNGYRKPSGEFIPCRPVYRQRIRFQDASWCFRLERKRRLVRTKRKTGHRMFRSIERSRTAEAQCIEIDHPRQLYLTDGFIPTHNTLGCIIWISEQALQGGGNGRNYWWIAPVSTQADIAFTRMLRYLPKGAFTANRTLKTVVLMNGAVIWFKGADRPDCYDDQTEILTRRGWKFFKDLQSDDEIMSRSPGGEAQWQRPTRIVHYRYDGEMVSLQSGHLDLVVTPHHRQLVGRRRGHWKPGKWDRGAARTGKVSEIAEEWTTAQELRPTDVIPAMASWAGADDAALTEDRLAMLGLYLAEGSAIGNASTPEKAKALVRRNGYRIFFAQTAGPKGGDKGDVRADFHEVLRRLGYEPRPRRDGLLIWDKKLWAQLILLGNKYTKFIPPEVKDLPAPKLQILLHWLIMGDGTSRPRANGSHEITYATVSKRLADDIQEIAIKCGMSPIIKIRAPQAYSRLDSKPSGHPLYLLSFPSEKFHCVASAKRRYYSRQRYSGTVSCASVPNTCMLVRRNGKPCWSGNTLYGEDVHAAVIDEASRLKETAWEAVRTTLVATRGPMRIIGNVKGRKNWFYRLSRRAESGRFPDMGYHKITAMQAVAAGVLVAEEIESAKETMTEHAFRELFLAEPSDDEGNPFGLQHIRSCIVGALSAGVPAVWGWDLAKRQDYTVGIALDRAGYVCRFERFQHMPWPDILENIVRMTGATPALVDSTGVGDPIVDFLQRRPGTRFEGYHFTPASKQKLMEGLSVAIQSHGITFPEGVLSKELEEFEYQYTRTSVKYSAPDGGFDDCVCALALAVMHKSLTPAPMMITQAMVDQVIASGQRSRL